VETRAEGICDECTSYETGLKAGVRSITRSGPSTDTLSVAGAAASEVPSPLGPLLLAATPLGLTRLAFEDHADADALRAHAGSRRGSQAARQYLVQAAASLQQYFAGEISRPSCTVDWEHLDATASALTTTETIPYATRRSYSDLDQRLPAHDLGLLFGANPIPIFMPCHRVTRGAETPDRFVGGTTRRTWLEAHEQTHPLPDRPGPA
jgi:methylated-DNA-[protein]-cysteine S-methyltransferase